MKNTRINFATQKKYRIYFQAGKIRQLKISELIPPPEKYPIYLDSSGASLYRNCPARYGSQANDEFAGALIPVTGTHVGTCMPLD